MTAPDLEIAALAVIIIGGGKYALEGIGDDAGLLVPMFLFGGHEEWFTENFGFGFKESAEHVFTNRSEDLAITLESVAVDGERTSMNDIAGRAKSIAEAIRIKYQHGNQNNAGAEFKKQLFGHLSRY